MLNLTKMKTLSAAALALAVIATPSLAAANSYSSTAYEACKRSDTGNQVLGGVLGAVAGGVFGSQVAGNGARTEGSAIGAVLGGLAGSQIANKDCSTSTAYRNEGSRSTAPVYSSGGYTTSAPVYSSGGYTTSAPVYSSDNYNTVYTSPRVAAVNYSVSQPTYRDGRSNRSYGYNDRRDERRYQRLAALDREIYETRCQLDELRQRSRYNNSRKLDRRIDRVGERLRDLKQERKRLK